MEIEIKGHSGCQIDVVRDGRELFVYKSSRNPKYLDRLVLQAKKQQAAQDAGLQHIRIPRIHAINRTGDAVVVKMDYVYSRNFIEYFDNAGFEQIDYLVGALTMFVDYEVSKSEMRTVPGKVVSDKFTDVKKKTLSSELLTSDPEVVDLIERSEKVFKEFPSMEIPVGTCHGDLTFSNILFNGNNYYLIDFLDSFIESPLLDIVKLRQDTAWLWSPLMYIHPYDAIRLQIAFGKIDSALDEYFTKHYPWYGAYYSQLQLMNFLRILQYANDTKVIDYLKQTINAQLNTL